MKRSRTSPNDPLRSPGEYAGDVNRRKDALFGKCIGEQRAIANFFADAVDVLGEFGVSETVGQQIERLEDR